MKHTAILFLLISGIYSTATAETLTPQQDTGYGIPSTDDSEYEYDVFYISTDLDHISGYGWIPRARKIVFGEYEIRYDPDFYYGLFYNPSIFGDPGYNTDWNGAKEVVLPKGRFQIDWYAFTSDKMERAILPDNVELRIFGPVFKKCPNFKEFVSMSPVPPNCALWPGDTDVSETIDDLCYWFDKKDYANVTLIVPAGSEEAYRKAITWRLFPKIVGVEDIESYMETAGITDIAADNADSAVIMPSAGGGVTVTSESAVQVEIYTPSGLLVARRQVLGTETIPLQTGLYIIRTGSRTTKIRI